jgi:PAS domain S-box-containing protein
VTGKDKNNTMQARIQELEWRLEEANDTLEAVRTGQVDALVVNSQDGTSLYTLKSADHAYRIFIERMAEGAVTLNAFGLIVYSNSRFASMVGQPLVNVIGSSFSEFILQDNKQAFTYLLEKGWHENVKGEVELTIAHGHIAVQLSISPLQVEGITSLNVIVTDLTLQNKSQQELKEKNEMLRKLNEALSSSNHDLQQFASIASHDLQEPLRKIQVYSKFLKDKNSALLPDASKAHIEKIISSSNRMKTLIVDILTYSRLSAVDTSWSMTNLRILFEDILEDFDLRISEKNAIIELGNLPTIEVNKGQLRQVFTNLVSNALKFSKPGTRPHIVIESKEVKAKELGVRLTYPENYCCLVIRDNGIGFDEKYGSTIFNLFEKLNPKSSFEGSGIGLAIAKKIIDKHHGLIMAKSREGEGSEFSIILPIRHTRK